MFPLSVHPVGLVTSDSKSVVGVQVCFLYTGSINVVCMKSFSKRKFLIVDPFCIPLKNVQGSKGFLCG